MSYVVEQKIKGRIYLYNVESYWDKGKKQARQKRTYIGPKNGKNKTSLRAKKTDLISKNYGNIFLLNCLSDKLTIKQILKSVFPDNYLEILALAYYDIIDASPMYLFHYWLNEQYLSNVKKLRSSKISDLCEYLGRSEKQRMNVIDKWAEYLKPIKGIFYDITSISSFSTNIDFIEWGYNRDKEKLPQLNMGVTFCQNNLLPIHYNLYPGSIVDVTTLKNCVKTLDIFHLHEILFVLDRGFFSKANILEMNNRKNKVTFLQPLPFSLKKVKELANKYKRKISNTSNAFKFNNEILHYMPASIDFDGVKFNVHIYFNEKAEIDQKHHFLSSLLEIEKKIKNKKFNSMVEYLAFRDTNIPNKYMVYFKWNKTSFYIERNVRVINSHISKMGIFLILTNCEKINKEEVLKNYRQRDNVEKIFDILKNEIDGNRLRAHSQYNVNGRLFIKFISMILYAEISKTMKNTNLFNQYSVKELFAELKKLKMVKINDDVSFLSEISKKQKNIFKAFEVMEKIKT
jgi:transposase